MTRKASIGRVFSDTFRRITSMMGGWDSTLRSVSGNRAGSQQAGLWPHQHLLSASPLQHPISFSSLHPRERR